MACSNVVPRSNWLPTISSVTGNFFGKLVHLLIISGLDPFRYCLPYQTSSRHCSAAGGTRSTTGVTHLRKSSNDPQASKRLKNSPMPTFIRPFAPVAKRACEASSVNCTSFGSDLGLSASMKPGKSCE